MKPYGWTSWIRGCIPWMSHVYVWSFARSSLSIPRFRRCMAITNATCLTLRINLTCMSCSSIPGIPCPSSEMVAPMIIPSMEWWAEDHPTSSGPRRTYPIRCCVRCIKCCPCPFHKKVTVISHKKYVTSFIDKIQGQAKNAQTRP